MFRMRGSGFRASSFGIRVGDVGPGFRFRT